MRSMKFAKCYKCKVSVGHIAFKRFLLLSLSRLTFSPFCFHERKIAPSVSRSFPSTHPSLLLSLESTPIPISESSFLSLSLSLFFAPHLDGHCSRSIALSHSRISRIRFCRTRRQVFLSSFFLFLAGVLARFAHPWSSSIMRSCALTLSRPRSVLPTPRTLATGAHFSCFSLRRVVTRVGWSFYSVLNCHTVHYRVASRRVARFLRSETTAKLRLVR